MLKLDSHMNSQIKNRENKRIEFNEECKGVNKLLMQFAVKTTFIFNFRKKINC